MFAGMPAGYIQEWALAMTGFFVWVGLGHDPAITLQKREVSRDFGKKAAKWRFTSDDLRILELETWMNFKGLKLIGPKIRMEKNLEQLITLNFPTVTLLTFQLPRNQLQFFSYGSFVAWYRRDLSDSEIDYGKKDRLEWLFFIADIQRAANFEKVQKSWTLAVHLKKWLALINRYQAGLQIHFWMSIRWGNMAWLMQSKNTSLSYLAIFLWGHAKRRENLVEEVGYRMGLDMKMSGIQFDLAPAQTLYQSQNIPVIGYRILWTDPKR